MLSFFDVLNKLVESGSLGSILAVIAVILFLCLRFIPISHGGALEQIFKFVERMTLWVAIIGVVFVFLPKIIEDYSKREPGPISTQEGFLNIFGSYQGEITVLNNDTNFKGLLSGKYYLEVLNSDCVLHRHFSKDVYHLGPINFGAAINNNIILPTLGSAKIIKDRYRVEINYDSISNKTFRFKFYKHESH